MATLLATLSNAASSPSSCDGCSDTLSDDTVPVNRRTALAKSVLAAIAATLTGACATSGTAAGVSAGASAVAAVPLGSWGLRVRASDFPELSKTGGIARVDGTSDKPVAVVKTEDGYQAFSLRCPHAGATVEPKDGAFLCPGHGAQFAADGTWTGGHRAKNLKALAVTYDAHDGILTIAA